MENNPAFRNEHTKEFFLNAREKIIRSKNAASGRIGSYSDEDKSMVFTIDYSLNFHSVDISERLYTLCIKSEIIERMVNIINRAIIKSSMMGADEVKKAISTKEFADIMSTENREIQEGIANSQDNFMRALKNLSNQTKTVASDSGNISLVITGDKMIKSLSISDEYLSPENRTLLEQELLHTLNRAVQETQKDLQSLLTKTEEEMKKLMRSEENS
jgi:DNA-binding protein YbaB